MKRLLLGLLGSFLLLLLGKSLPISSEVNKGEKLYITHCSACHNLEGSGKGIFPSLTEVVDIVGKEGLFTIIKKGREETGMPPISGLSEQELEDIYAYLKTLKKTGEGQGGRGAGEKIKTEGAKGREGEGAKKTGKESVAAEEKPEKEKKKVLSVDSLRALGIPLNDRIVASYEKARRLPALFAELPCFCGCGWINHSHLLNCFQTTHGAKCALCQEEAEIAERLHMQHQLNKLMASPETPRSLDEAERLRKEEADLNKKIALTMVKLFWKRRAVGGLHEF